MGHREGYRAGVQAVPRPHDEGGQGQALQSGLGSAPDITGAG